jgi:hypothetical protein
MPLSKPPGDGTRKSPVDGDPKWRLSYTDAAAGKFEIMASPALPVTGDGRISLPCHSLA